MTGTCFNPRWTRRLLVAVVGLALTVPTVSFGQGSPPPWEQDAGSSGEVEWLGWGAQGGFSIDPDQLVIGLHTDLAAFQEDLLFRPLFELGFGDNVTLLDFELDALYRLRGSDLPGLPYLGAGLAIVHYRFDLQHGHGASNSEAGLHLIGGIERDFDAGHSAYLELKLGVGDVPDFKRGVGFTLGRGRPVR